MKTSKAASLPSEYDFSQGARGKYARHFPTARKVNQSLRTLLPAAKRASRPSAS